MHFGMRGKRLPRLGLTVKHFQMFVSVIKCICVCATLNFQVFVNLQRIVIQ